MKSSLHFQVARALALTVCAASLAAPSFAGVRKVVRATATPTVMTAATPATAVVVAPTVQGVCCTATGSTVSPC